MKYCWPLAVFCVFASVVFAQPKPQAGRDEIKKTLIELENKSWIAWKNRDGKYFDNFLSDDHVEIEPDGVAGKAAVVSIVGSPICVVKSYTVRDYQFTLINKETALLTYHAEQDTTCNGNAVPSPTWVSSLYVLRKGRWQNVLYQHTKAVR